MSSKISALPAATSVLNADLATIVTAGVNKAVSVRDLLHSVGSQVFTIQNAGAGYFGWEANDDFTIYANAGKNTKIFVGGNFQMGYDASGNLYLLAVAGGFTTMQAGGGAVVVTAAGAIALAPLAGQIVAIGYTPANPGDWVVPPTDLLVAVDRIARVVSALGTVPIP